MGRQQQRHRLDHIQITRTSLQTDTTSAPHHSAFTGWLPFLPPNISVKALKCDSLCAIEPYQRLTISQLN